MQFKHIAMFSALALAACHPSSTPPDAAPSAPASTPASRHARSLADLDTRRPVALTPMMADHQLTNMRDHLVAVQEITAALATSDFQRAEAASLRLGTSDSMTMMCEHMGMAAPGFTAQALHFHQTADQITAAARAGDRDQALDALSRTLETCTGCHQTWRQEIVSDEEWSRRVDAIDQSSPR